MRRGPIKTKELPNRFVEYYWSISNLKKLSLKVRLLTLELFSHIYPFYHFDSIWDFLINQGKLGFGSEVSFSSYARIINKSDNGKTLDLVISDDSGRATIIYLYDSRLIDIMKERKAHLDPLYWSLEGDRVRICVANYLGSSTLVLKGRVGLYFTLNEDHYQRFLNSGNVLLGEAAKR